MDRVRELGIRIYKARVEQNLTQTELAEKAGISLQYLQNLESKTPKNPSFLTLSKISEALNLPLWKLLKP